MKISEAWMVAFAIIIFVLGGFQGAHAVSASSTPSEIDLSSVANVYALTNAGSAVLGGGIDGLGYAYAENLSGPSINWNGATFALGTAGSKNGVRQATLTLPAGNYASLMLLATGVNGNWPNQTFVVNYTDGTHTNVVQSLSDWHTPQGYAGESQAFNFTYRINSTGGTGTGPFYIYGYSFALDTSRTVQSLTLPNNSHIVVLAVDLIPTGTVPTAATPTMSPAPGTYSTAQSVTLSDTTPGATIYYTTNGTTPTTSSAKYSSPVSVAATTTIEAIAVASGYNNSAVATGTYTITPTSTSVSVGLSAVANVNALANAGSPVLGGGIDGLGFAYAENLSGPSISWNGATFALGTAGSKNGVRQATVTLPAGNYSNLMLLATGVNGNQPNQTFVVNYTDGTHASFVQSLSDWFTPQNYAGESKAFTFAYRLNSTGATGTGPFYLYGYSFALDTGKTVQSLTLPNNSHVVVLAVELVSVGSPTLVCNPLTFGAIGDGTTDNTTAIQNAINQCAGQGGGTVELSVVGKNSTYLTGPFTLKSHVHLQVDQGVLLQATHTHSRYVPAFINWVYQPHEALISAKGATDVAIVGAGIIDGAGDQPDPSDGGRSWYDLQSLETSHHPLRPWLLEFYQCDHVTVSGVTLRNAAEWNQSFRFSSNVTESSVTILGTGPNTDGVDLVGVTTATLSDLNINVIDDDIAIKSGLAINTSDPDYSKEIGLPQMPTSNVRITNITATNGEGIAIGSELANGVNNITIDGVNLTNTAVGFRIKTARDRGGPIYNISVNHFKMNVTNFSIPRTPIVIDSYYFFATGPDPWQAAQPLTSHTPYLHDISIQNFVATNTNSRSFIQGLPESCIRNVTLNGVSIQGTTGPGIDLHHMTGTFTNVTSTPAPTFVVDQNVSVTTAGTTPPITNTPPGSGQIACSSQGVPP